MKAKKYAVLAVIVILSIVIFSASVKGISEGEKLQKQAFGVSTLKGIPSIWPVVTLGEDAKSGGLRKLELQTQVELALRKAGVNVAEEYVTDKGQAFLEVRVMLNSIKAFNDTLTIYAFNITIELYQNVILERDPKIMTYIPTWPRGYCYSPGVASELKLKETVKKNVDTKINEFINDYLAANPKEPAIEKNQLPTKMEKL